PIAAVVLLLPSRAAAALGPTADAQTRAAQLDGLDYPADDSIATASSATLHESTCTEEGPKSGEAQLHGVSLFGGEVTAARVTLTLGATASASIVGLVVDGKDVVGSGEERVPLQGWGYVV